MKFFRRVAAVLPAFVLACAICVAADEKPSPATAATDTKPASAKAKGEQENIVEMSPFIVTAKTRGLIPFGAYVRLRLIGRICTTPAFIYKSEHPLHLASLEKYGLSVEDRIISIDGEKIQGTAFSRLREIWCEGDPGRQVTLVVQDSGEKESVFRKVVVTTISVARLKKIEEEWHQQQAAKEKEAKEAPPEAGESSKATEPKM